jgi:hypothetical protein
MFNRENAEATVVEKLTEYAQTPVAVTEVIEKSYGWVFFWNSKKYVETGSLSDFLFGNGPVIFRRSDGAMTYLTTALTVEEQLAKYEQEHPGE